MTEEGAPEELANEALDRGALIQLAVLDDDDLLEEFIAQLPADRLARFIVATRTMASALRKALGWAESRYGTEVGTAHQEGDDVYVWRGDESWELPDPDGLVIRLRELAREKPIWAGRIREAFEPTYKFNQAKLNELRGLDPDLKAVIDDFRKRKYGPPHLRKWE